MPSTFGIAPLIPGLVNEVAFEVFLHFVAVDWDGPFTLVLVCTAWKDMVFRSNFLQSLRRNRRGGNPALKENREKPGKGICIVSFDGGGPGSLSQLRMLDELMLRLAFKPGDKVDELRPADYFDLMGGVGFGGLVALLLGRLRMTTSRAMDELAAIGTKIFPEGEDMVTREVNMARLRGAIESMLERHGHPVGIKLHDSSENRCKVVLFAAPTLAMDHCHVFRTYLAPRKNLECTLVDAACATMAIPEYFSAVAIGPRWRKQSFAGIPRGFDNPMREVLKESQLVFGETNPVSLVLSLGSGQRARHSDLDRHITRSSSIRCDGVARGLQYQLQGVAEYLRLNVDNGMENIEVDDWPKLGSIETFTNIYLEMNLITKYIDKACQWLRKRNGSVTLGRLTGTNADCVVKFHSESLESYLKMEFKEMKDVMGIERITLVDAIGRPIRIPIEFCLTYPMLLDVINLYFKHKKAPESDFVERGDYRLVHGDCKNIMGQMEWTRIDKTGLKVEMSMILRTRNQNSARCPSCSTSFEGHVIDGWARCLFCATQFQTETQVQVEPQDQWEDTAQDTTQSDEEPLVESDVTSIVREFESRQPLMRERPSGGEAVKLQFRLISVINSIAVPESFMAHPNDLREAPFPHQNNVSGNPGVVALHQPSAFAPTTPKDLEVFPAASKRNTHTSPYVGTRQVEKSTPILIEPPKADHSHINQCLIDALPSTLKRILERWSGESREDQENVLNKLLKELDKISQNIITNFAHSAINVDIEDLRQLLNPLCGPEGEGRLCLVNRGGTPSGVSSIACNKCNKSFDSNPVQAYAHHIITFHWQIKAFACYAPECSKRFAWTHDRDRHERSKHHLYRRKAYDLAMKLEAEKAAQPKAHWETPNALTDAEIMYQAFRGYNEGTN